MSVIFSRTDVRRSQTTGRRRRQTAERPADAGRVTVHSVDRTPLVTGLRVEAHAVEAEDGIVQVLAGDDVTLRLFGYNLHPAINLTFTKMPKKKDSVCEFPAPDVFTVSSRFLRSPLNIE